MLDLLLSAPDTLIAGPYGLAATVLLVSLLLRQRLARAGWAAPVAPLRPVAAVVAATLIVALALLVVRISGIGA